MMMNPDENENPVSSPVLADQAPPEDHPPPAVPAHPGVPAPPGVRAPPEFNADYCYSLLTLADGQITANRENIARLAQGAVSIRNQIKDYERLQNKG